MKIALVSQFVYPHGHEVRLKKISETLLGDGHEVVVLCKWEAGRLTTEHVNGVEIHRNAPLRWIPKLNAALTLHLAYNPVWFIWLMVKCRALGVDTLIVRNLRLGMPSILAARVLGLSMIADLSENYPALATIEGKNRLQDVFTRTRALEAFFEKWTARLADHVWVVVEENRDRLVNGVGISPDKITVVSNVPTAESIDDLVRYRRDHPSKSDKTLTLVFLGIVDALRGLDVLIQAVAEANRRGAAKRVRLLVIGDGPAREDLEALTEALGSDADVEFTGWIDSKEKYRFLAEGDFGVIPHVDCELCQTTIPNKLFDYLGAGIPALATDLAPIRRVIETHDCGTVVRWGRDDMATDLMNLTELSADALEEMGERGREAVNDTFNWGYEEAAIRTTLKHIADAGARDEDLVMELK
jgi:glycosyltransferase involved in cell wall biosynthesis